MDTMVYKGEVTCPLCMEIMDLTDQQFKPCECGYEICVWCWHHLIEVAEKDGTEGCCPACRNPYDKNRILGRTISSERLAELNFEKQKLKKKHKDVRLGKLNSEIQYLQTEKPEILESRKELSTVRVIQRKVAYIANVPVFLANEEIFRKKEFLGQYGKVEKIFISHAIVDIQRFPSSRVVFATFSKEEEALQCIQAVNGFVLEGYPLKACFGAAKYCTAWLRNMRCENRGCFNLHKLGSLEDTCTKDEVPSTSASKLHQCSEIALNSFNRRSGNVLPPPVDNIHSSSHITTSECLDDSEVHSLVVDSKNSLRNNDCGRAGFSSVPTSCESRMNSSDGLLRGPFDHPSVSSSPSMSGAGMEPHIGAQPRDGNQNNKQIVLSSNKKPFSNGNLTDVAPSKLSIKKSYHGNSITMGFKASVETNILINDTGDEQKSILPYSHPNKQNQLLSCNASIRCCTADKTRTASSCWRSRAVGNPITSEQDTALSSIQAKTPGPVLRTASSENVPKGSSDLELRGSASKSESKTNLLSFYDQLHGGVSISSDGATMGRTIGECSTNSTLSIGISPNGGKKMMHTGSTDCGISHSELQNIKYRSENSVSLGKDMIQSSGMLAKENGAPIESSTLSNKAFVESKVDGIAAGTLPVALGLVDLIEPHRLAKLFSDANKKHEYSRSNSWISDSNEYSSFVRMNNTDHAGGHIFSSTSDLLDRRKSSHDLDGGGRKTFNTNKSLTGLTVQDSNNSEMFNSKHNVTANGFQLTSSLNYSASPVSTTEPCSSLPRHQDRLLSAPTYWGSTDNCSPGVNCIPKDSYTYPDNLMFSRGRVPQSPKGLSNTVGFTMSDSTIQPQSRFGNLSQNSVVSDDRTTEKLLKEAMKNYYWQHEPCSTGSTISNEPKFEAPGFSYFHYPQH